MPLCGILGWTLSSWGAAMAQPTPFNPPYNFASDLGTQHGTRLDTTFQSIKNTLTQVLANMALLQRDDGLLMNQSVGADQLAAGIMAILAVNGGTAKGNWVAATTYIIDDVVTNGGSTYMCAANHVAGGTFNVDYAAGKWILIQSVAGLVAANTVSLTPTGGVAATTVQSAVAELDTEKAATTGSASNKFSVAAATAATDAVNLSQAQGNSLRFVVAAGDGNAMTATLSPAASAALSDGFQLFIRAPGANSVTTPTLNLTLGATPTGAITITRATTNGALVAGSIAGNTHVMHLIYNLAQNKWQILNPAA
jgi:hypothetical protein